MEYTFGYKSIDGKEVETLRVKRNIAEGHVNYEGVTQLEFVSGPSTITDTFVAVRKYDSKSDAESCYDWFVIENHKRYEKSIALERKCAELEKAIIELSEIIGGTINV